MALLLIAGGVPDASAADRRIGGVHPPKQNIITPALMVLTVFFMLLSLSNAGIGNFGVVALMSGYGASFSIGQYRADRLSRLQRRSACWRAAFSPTAPGATARSPPPALRINAAIVLVIALVAICRRRC